MKIPKIQQIPQNPPRITNLTQSATRIKYTPLQKQNRQNIQL